MAYAVVTARTIYPFSIHAFRMRANTGHSTVAVHCVFVVIYLFLFFCRRFAIERVTRVISLWSRLYAILYRTNGICVFNRNCHLYILCMLFARIPRSRFISFSLSRDYVRKLDISRERSKLT